MGHDPGPFGEKLQEAFVDGRETLTSKEGMTGLASDLHQRFGAPKLCHGIIVTSSAQRLNST